MNKSFVLFGFAFLLLQVNSVAQISPSDMLEKAIGSVVTVGVFENAISKKPLGFRGAPSDLAYNKVLDLTGVTSSGSGFVIDQNNKKYVITNAHVVEQASDKEGSISVFSISRKKYEAKIVGGDSFYDIAVLEFVTAPGEEISALKFTANEPRIGEQVYAIGNPLGEYPYSVSEGIISAKNRVRNGLTGKFGFLQTTATVIWGNSGGPLVNVSGDVAGINSQIAFANQGGNTIWQPQINFALESKIASRLISDILNHGGLIQRAYLGIQVTQMVPGVSQDSYRYNEIAEETAKEKYPIITSVIKNSPAEKVLAGKIGYGIQSVNGTETRNIEELLGEFENAKPGSDVSLTIIKDGKPENIIIKTTNLDVSKGNEMAFSLALKEGWTLTQNSNQVNFKFNKEKVKKSNTDYSFSGNGEEKKTETDNNTEWTLVAAGKVDRYESNIWRINLVADLATALRLTSLSGYCDVVLLKKGSDPEVNDNYLVKRLKFSENEEILATTLFY